MRTTFTWDPGPQPSRIVQPTGCGYPVNMIYDPGPNAPKVLPQEPPSDEPTVIESNEKPT